MRLMEEGGGSEEKGERMGEKEGLTSLKIGWGVQKHLRECGPKFLGYFTEESWCHLR